LRKRGVVQILAAVRALTVLVALLAALCLAAPASAVVSGTYDSGTGVLTVTMDAAGDTATVSVDFVGTILVNGVATSPAATVNNTDTIRITDSSAGGTTAVIDGIHRFRPGRDGEMGSFTREIEFEVELGAGAGDVLRATLDQAGSHLSLGRGSMNLSADEPGPKDDDVTLRGVERVELAGGGGNDRIDGSNAFATPLVITGGGGRDLIGGGGGNDRINTRDGDGNDIVGCLRGDNDRATVDQLDAVGNDCEVVRRGGGGGGGPGAGTPRIRIPDQVLTYQRSRVGVRLRCLRGARCRGRVRVRRRMGGELQTLATGFYNIPPGRTRTAVLQTGSAGFRYFNPRRRQGGGGLTVVADLRGGRGAVRRAVRWEGGPVS
jgi:hypothetical protein